VIGILQTAVTNMGCG